MDCGADRRHFSFWCWPWTGIFLFCSSCRRGFHWGFSHFHPWKKVRSAGQVSADLPRHVSSWTPAAYVQSKGFHEEEKKEKEEAEYERRMQVLNRRVRDDIPLSPTEYAAWRRWSGLPPLPSSSAGKRRKRKKRRKSRLPRSPRPRPLSSSTAAVACSQCGFSW